MENVPMESRDFVLQIASKNKIGKISVEMIQQLANGSLVRRGALEMPIMLMLLGDLIECGTIDGDVLRMFISLLESIDSRSAQFLQTLWIIPDFYSDFLAAKPDFIDIFIHTKSAKFGQANRTFPVVATDRCRSFLSPFSHR
jgi:hypothetical protein